MRLGLDTFTIRELELNAFQTLDYVADHGLEGAQFGGLRGLSASLDSGELGEVRAHADRLGLYTHVSIATCNPFLVKGDLDAHVKRIREEIAVAAECGWHELHSSLGGGDERYEHAVPWTEHLDGAAALIRRLSPVLHEHGSRIDLETHGDTTTFELVRLIEDVGPDVAGICLDTANVLCHAEDPVEAARRAAPYTHLTHVKDAIIFFTDEGYRRQTLPAGSGALDWERILPVLAADSPDLPLSIEDHKWLFDFPVFDPQWISLHPDLAPDELASVMRLAWQCHRKLFSGELPDPDEREKIPFVDELEERLLSGQRFLEDALGRLGLASANSGEEIRP